MFFTNFGDFMRLIKRKQLIIFLFLFFSVFTFYAFTSSTNSNTEKHTSSSKHISKKLKKKLITFYKKKGKFYVSVKVKNADIKVLFHELADIKKLNLVVEPNIKGTITVSFHNIEWNSALKSLLSASGLVAKVDSKIIYLHSYK